MLLHDDKLLDFDRLIGIFWIGHTSYLFTILSDLNDVFETVLWLGGVADVSQLVCNFVMPLRIHSKNWNSIPKSNWHRVECIVPSILRVVSHCLYDGTTDPLALKYFKTIHFHFLLDHLATQSNHYCKVKPLNLQWVLRKIFVLTAHSIQRFRRCLLSSEAALSVCVFVIYWFVLFELSHVSKLVSKAVAPGRQFECCKRVN